MRSLKEVLEANRTLQIPILFGQKQFLLVVEVIRLEAFGYEKP